jgi:hypothetical protein
MLSVDHAHFRRSIDALFAMLHLDGLLKNAADGAGLAVFGGELLDHLHVAVEIGDGAGNQAALLCGAA